MAVAAAPIRLERVDHYFGRGRLRRQVLCDVNAEVRSGEIVILTGPSGSGKTTALTLIGALRSAQHGSLTVLGEELVGAAARTHVRVRRQVGYVFQHHNLLDALDAAQNVEMALQIHPELRRRERRHRARAMLEAVGLQDHARALPSELSGGQKQRVAVARALACEPRLILADEPTASLDRESGREVVGLMQRLARDKGATLLMVTHDARILDVADRILHMEDGRLVSFGSAVLAGTSQMMKLLADSNRKGELASRVEGLDEAGFASLLQGVTDEAERFLRVSRISSEDAFESMLDQMLEVCTRKIGEILDADRASLFLLDTGRGELWSKAARDAGGAPFEIRIPRDSGIAGAVVASGEPMCLEDAYTDDRFNREVDRDSGYRTHSLMCVPLRDLDGRVFGAAQALNKRGGKSFDESDLRRFTRFTASLSVLLESWWRMRENEHREQAPPPSLG